MELLSHLRAAWIVEAVVHLGRIVRKVVKLARARGEVERALVRAGAHGPQLQADAAARWVNVPLAVGNVARFRLPAEQLLEASALQGVRRCNLCVFVEGWREIER